MSNMIDREWSDFNKQTNYIKAMAGIVLVEYFGERCKEFEETCECCKRWKALDDLIENPFDKDK